MSLRSCQFCGKTFSAKKTARKFCSRSCNSKAVHRKIAAPKTCERCGKPFVGMPIKRFCSTKCREAARWERKSRKQYAALPTPRFGFWGI